MRGNLQLDELLIAQTEQAAYIAQLKGGAAQICHFRLGGQDRSTPQLVIPECVICQFPIVVGGCWALLWGGMS